MKIAIVGCGALGSYYGAMLCRDGQDVHFLLRSDYETVRRNGVFIRSPAGDFNTRPHCARKPEEIGVVDLVIIGLKTTANDQFAQLLPPLVGPNTILLTLQNGLGNEEQLARLFAAEQIMGGLCFVCLNRVPPGVIQHTAHGVVVLGEFQGCPQPRTHDIAGMFQHAGVSCKVTDRLARAHWEKLVWNIPFNGLGVASVAGYEAVVTGNIASGTHGSCLPTDKLLADPRWEKLVRELMQEVLAIAGSLGFEIPKSFAEKQVERTRTMGAYRASTLVDFERGAPLEIESLFGEPLRQAKKTGVSAPRLEALCQLLRELDRTASQGGGTKPGTILLKDGQTVAFLGDSITEYGWGRPEGYVRLVAEELAARGIHIKIIPAGVCGHKSTQMLRRLKRDILSQNPDWMLLSCGINDVWHGEKGVPLDQFKTNITSIVDQCQSAGVKVMILTTTVLGEDLTNNRNRDIAAYNDFLRSLARERNYPLTDLNQLFHETILAGPQSGTLLTTDGAHMNPLGDRLMAYGILQALGVKEEDLTKFSGS